jgi:hypothetical protein
VDAQSPKANAYRRGEEADEFSQLLSHNPSPLATEGIFSFFVILFIILAILLAQEFSDLFLQVVVPLPAFMT